MRNIMLVMDEVVNITHRQKQQQLWAKYDYGLETQQYYAFGYPYGLIPTFIVLIYLLIPSNSQGRNYGRYLAWIGTVLSSAYIIAYSKARYPVFAALTGLAHSWLILWVTAHFLVHDAKKYFHIKKITHSVYVWQPHPLSIQERYDWAMDLIASLSGMGWSWGLRSLPAPPSTVQESLQKQGLNLPIAKTWEKIISAQLPSLPTTSRIEFKRYLIFRLCVIYIILDLIKTLMTLDPYFWGFTEHQSLPYLPSNWQSAFINKSIRLIISLSAAYYAVSLVLIMRPIYQYFIRKVDPQDVRSEPWMYPDDFGKYSTVYEHGLAGFWGMYWHQAFRYVFEAPAILTCRILKLHPRQFNAKIIRVFTSFACSGFMHACLSYSSIGDRSPIGGSFMFFMLQPFAMMFQFYWNKHFQASTYHGKFPKVLGPIANVLFVNIWLYFTAPLFIDDLSRGGWFLFEPVPISIFRGLGFGAVDDGWFALQGRYFTFRQDSWRSGLVS